MELYDIRKEYDQLSIKINNLLSRKEFEDFSMQLKKMNEEKEQSGFWDNPKTASALLKKEASIIKKIEKKKLIQEVVEEFELMIELTQANEFTLDELNDELLKLKELYENLELDILLNEKYDDCDVLVEINPGAGGTESQDWALMLHEMYVKYSKKHGYKVRILNYQPGDGAGLKNSTIEIQGDMLYGKLKKESGVHRLVRISPFDSANRRHTSFASVKVTPLIDDEINIKINDNELKIDTYRSSGAGGQSVNTTDSAVRILHIPTNISVTCQNERSQIKNRETALKILKIKLYNFEEEKRQKEKDKILQSDQNISFGSQKRSYVLHPYKMIKDSESGYETSNVSKVLNGNIDDFLYHNIIGKV